MYTEHFGLNEKPFSISPDPRYLYMSRRHADALAHLVYGISESGGFIQLTGEVGTGKTTLIRSLLEQLPEQADIALILNPQLSTREFLSAICQELGVPAPDQDSVKALIDHLNARLLQSYSADRRTVLIVDEAQTLSPELLEQVRLLTNLETNRAKLLQIILIGQPELRDMLEKPEMRQIAQRVTGRYHLEPLGREDTAVYVRHRMKVAGARAEIFSPAALRAIYRKSRGIPRLINTVADRALLAAYAQDRRTIGRALTGRAAAEVLGTRTQSRRWTWAAATAMGAAAFALTTTNLWTTAPWNAAAGDAEVRSPALEPAPAAQTPAVRADARPAGGTAAEGAAAEGAAAADTSVEGTEAALPGDPRTADAAVSLEALLADPDLESGTDTAARTLFALWDASYAADRGTACEQAERQGLQCMFRRDGALGELRRMNRPSILALSDGAGAMHQAVLTGLGYDRAELTIGGATYEVGIVDLTHHWYGEHLLLWKPALPGAENLAPGMRSEAVRWLRQSLASLLGANIAASEPLLYDPELESAVRAYQRERMLTVDGIVGARTQIALTSDLGLPDVPVLEKAH